MHTLNFDHTDTRHRSYWRYLANGLPEGWGDTHPNPRAFTVIKPESEDYDKIRAREANAKYRASAATPAERVYRRDWREARRMDQIWEMNARQKTLDREYARHAASRRRQEAYLNRIRDAVLADWNEDPSL